MQLLISIKVHQEIANTIEKNINMTIEAGSEQMIRVSNVLVLDKLFDKHNATDQMGKYFNLTSLDEQSINLLSKSATEFNITMHRNTISELYQAGAMAFQIEIYDLESDDDWFGTIFSAVLGIAQIFVGVAMLEWVDLL